MLIRHRPRPFARPLPIACAFALLTTLLVGFTPDSAGASITTLTFTGTVDAAGTSYLAHPFTVESPGSVSVTLNWDDGTADLNVFLKDPTGAIAASSTSTTARPEIASATASASQFGAWKLGVKAITGRSGYTATVTFPTSPRGTVSGMVWDDVDHDGIHAPEETAGIAAATITLLDGAGGALGTTTSGENGTWSFTSRPPGSYAVQIDLPPGFGLGAKDQGADDTVDSDIDPASRRSDVLSLAPEGSLVLDASVATKPGTSTQVFSGNAASSGTAYRSHSFQVDATGQITVRLDWADPSATMNVFLKDPAGTTVAALTTSDKPKVLRFNATATGLWSVGVKATTGATDYEATVTFPASPYVSVGDRVFLDVDGNGIQDAAETSGVAGVTINLRDATDAVVASATTTSSGLWSFSGLPAGDYVIEAVLPYRYGISPVDQGSDDAVDSDIVPATRRSGVLRLVPGARDTTVDVGVTAPPTTASTFTGSVDALRAAMAAFTFDVRDSGTIDLVLDWTDPSADLNLFLKDPSGVQVAAQTSTTAKPERITLQASAQGTYTLVVRARSGASAFTVTATYPSNPTVSVGDRIFDDTNGDGIQQPAETAGIANVTVRLRDAATGAELASTTSDATGAYGFSGQPAGSYVVEFAPLPGFVLSPALQGSDRSLDSNADPATGRTAPFSVAEYGTDRTIDAGIASRPGGETALFTGSVSNPGTSYVEHTFNVYATGSLSANLDWGTSTADLNLFLKDPNGVIVAQAISATARPETLTATLNQLGTWRLSVKAKTGSSSYSLVVNYPKGTPPAPIAAYASTFGYEGHAGLYPYGLAWDGTDRSLVTGDIWNYRVLRYTDAGSYVGQVSRNAQQGQLGGIGSNFGVATDAGGNVWVADQSNARIVQFDHVGNFIKSIGVGGGPEPWQSHALGCGGGLMNRPTSLFIHPVSGNIFVTDTICRDIEVFSNDGHWLYNFNLDLRDLGIFTPIPRGIDIGPDGLVYFVEFNLKRVFVYDVNGVRQRVFPYQADLQDARGLSIDRTRGKVYVVDSGTNGGDIYQWNLDGTLVRNVKRAPSHDFNSIRFVASDDLGNVYVSDTWGHRVWKFDQNLADLPWSAPPLPPPDGGFNKLNGIGINPATGMLYAMDTFENRSQAFFTSVGGLPSRCISTADCPAFAFQWGSRKFPVQGTDGYNYPRALTFGGGSVWTDVGRAIARYRPDGTFVSRWGTQGSDPGQFKDNIFGLDVVGNETSGTVYATDSGNCRLQLFDYSGNLLAYMGSCGDGPDQMAHPNQVVVKGNLAYVADEGHNRVAVWDVTTRRIVSEIRGPFSALNLSQPQGVALSPDGTKLYIADGAGRRIVRIGLDGTSPEVVSTGQDTPQGSFLFPTYLEFGPDGHLYAADDSEHIYSFTINR